MVHGRAVVASAAVVADSEDHGPAAVAAASLRAVPADRQDLEVGIAARTSVRPRPHVGCATSTQQDHKPRGPIKERSGGRIYAVDDLEDDTTPDIDDVATAATPGDGPGDGLVDSPADTDEIDNQDEE